MSDLIIPSEIPWDDIKDKDLEELLYWLFIEMGAKDLEWRVGGEGSGGPDQGRDLECSFYISSPEGDLIPQKWWIEAKGTKSTVKPSKVKESVINVVSKKYIDVLVIATNSYCSNPTRDWIKDWQKNNPRPIIKLWERPQLENFCSRHPLAIIRLYSKALSPQGKIEVVRTKLWNHLSFTDGPALKQIWENRGSVEISPETLIALISSEFANGDIASRSWALYVNEEILINSLGYGLTNFLYLVFRANDLGVNQKPLIKAFSYMVLACIERIGIEQTTELLENIWDKVKKRNSLNLLKNIILESILGMLVSEIMDVCIKNCRRVLTDPIELTEKEIGQYWKRLIPSVDESEDETRKLILELFDQPCNVGFPVSKEQNCPLHSCEHAEENIGETIKIIKAVKDFWISKLVDNKE